MILKLMSWGLIFLVAVVQSAVTWAEKCYYTSTDASCSGVDRKCYDYCDYDSLDCDHATCRDIEYVAQIERLTALDECTTISAWGTERDAKARCEDDGVSACAGIDLCLTSCTSTSGVCGGDCFDSAWTAVDLADMGINGTVSCDTLLPKLRSYTNFSFTEWCECFTYEGVDETTDLRFNCGQGACSGSDGGSSNTGMIIGIVVGAVVLVIVIVVVVICMRRRKL